jgi:hypothetical protein
MFTRYGGDLALKGWALRISRVQRCERRVSPSPGGSPSSCAPCSATAPSSTRLRVSSSRQEAETSSRAERCRGRKWVMCSDRARAASRSGRSLANWSCRGAPARDRH